MDKIIDRNIPVTFNILNKFDNRFMRVKIWLMHLGENLAGSIFEKANVEKAIPSLANTPILGYVEDNSDGEGDFTDHRMILVREDGDVKVKYIGQAYGVIPQDNNAQFEVRVGDDGVAREYLTCEGLLWTKWDTAIDIMNRDGFKDQSMELDQDYEGHWDNKTGLFNFTNFKFFGACILGSGVNPAMRNASVEQMFSNESLIKEIQGKMEEFKVVFSRYQASLEDTNKNKDKEGDNMHEKLLELLAKYSLKEEVIQEKGFKLEDYSTEEELEAKLAEFSEVENQVVTDNFAEQIESLNSELASVKSELDLIKSQFETEKAEKIQLQESYTNLQDKYSTLEQESQELVSFKAAKIAEERQAEEDALFTQFSEKLSEDELAPVKEKASTMELSEIEKELFSIVGRKALPNFSAKDSNKGNVKVPFNKEDKSQNSSDYSHILEKYKK